MGKEEEGRLASATFLGLPHLTSNCDDLQRQEGFVTQKNDIESTGVGLLNEEGDAKRINRKWLYFM